MSMMSDIYTRLSDGIASIKQPHFDIAYCLSTLSKNGWYTSYGCSSVYELAERDFGLGKTSVKNYIAVCDKFMQGDTVIPMFADYSYTALVEMTSISVYDWQFIKPDMSIKEIRAWKQNHKFVTLEDGSVRMFSELSRSERESYEDYKASLKKGIESSQSTDHLNDVQSVLAFPDSVSITPVVPAKPTIPVVVENNLPLSFERNSKCVNFLLHYVLWDIWVYVPEMFLTVYKYNFSNGVSVCATEFRSYFGYPFDDNHWRTAVRYQIIDSSKKYDLVGLTLEDTVEHLMNMSKVL